MDNFAPTPETPTADIMETAPVTRTPVRFINGVKCYDGWPIRNTDDGLDGTLKLGLLTPAQRPGTGEVVAPTPLPEPELGHHGPHWLDIAGSVVYALEAGDKIKIGLTTDLKQRLATMRYDRNGKPDALVRMVIPGLIDLERQIQREFADDLAEKREWYHWTPKIERRLGALSIRHNGYFLEKEGFVRRDWLFLDVPPAKIHRQPRPRQGLMVCP